MKREAYNRFLSGMEPSDRERLLLMAVDYDIKPEDPEWIAFAAATNTLYAIERAIKDVRTAASDAANDIIRTTSNRLDMLGRQATERLAGNAEGYGRQVLEQANAALAQNRLTIAEDTAKAVHDHLARLVDPRIAALETAGRDFDAQRNAAGHALEVAASHAVVRVNAIDSRSLWQNIGYAALGSAVTAMLFILFLSFFPPSASPVTLDTDALAKQVTAAMRQQSVPVAAVSQHRHRSSR